MSSLPPTPKTRPDQHTGNSMPYSLRLMCGFFNVPQGYEHSSVVRRDLRFIVLIQCYVHTGPVPNGSDPILERAISVHTVPFRLSTSVHTGPVCYCSVLNRSKKSSCFYQLSMRRIHVVAFKNGAEVPKGTGPGVYTVTDLPKGTGPGVYTVTDPFGTGTVPKTGPAFL